MYSISDINEDGSLFDIESNVRAADLPDRFNPSVIRRILSLLPGDGLRVDAKEQGSLQPVIIDGDEFKLTPIYVKCISAYTGEVIDLNKSSDSERRIYHFWRGILERCNNPLNPLYEKYGGRGIKCQIDSPSQLRPRQPNRAERRRRR